MLNKEVREMIVKAYERTHNAREVAEILGIHRSTVHRLVKQMRETGNVEPKTKNKCKIKCVS